MTVRVITGSKREIAEQVASLEGEVREVIAFVEEPAPTPIPQALRGTLRRNGAVHCQDRGLRQFARSHLHADGGG